MFSVVCGEQPAAAISRRDKVMGPLKVKSEVSTIWKSK
jgi:hypothetical protein